MALETPVLVLGFNRPEELGGLLTLLRRQAPTKVYIAIDGPRSGVAGEADLVARARATHQVVDWPCTVQTLFREDNLGCGPGVSGAISWFFEHEKAGIILEDDIRPVNSFFPFVSELLERYEADHRVWAVSGNNFVPRRYQSEDASYRFSGVPHIWGWGTWRRTWEKYRFDIARWQDDLPPRKLLEAVGRSPAGYAFWWRSFNQVAKQADTWDFQFAAAAMAHGGLSATANVNLTENVGFHDRSTHTVAKPDYIRGVGELEFPLSHPRAVVVDSRADSWTRRHVYGATPLGIVRRGGVIARKSVQARVGNRSQVG